MARLAVRRCCLLVGVALFVLGFTTTMRTAVRVNITAIFEEEDFEDYQAVFYRTLQDFNNNSKDIHWFGQAVAAQRDLKATLSAVCNQMEGRRSSLHVLIVFGNVSTIQTVNLLSQTLGIPMMGYMMDKGDGYIQVHNPFYLSLQPANTHMARGLVSLLAVNYWYRVTLLVENEMRYDGFRNTFRNLTSDDKWLVEDELFLSRGLSDQQIEDSLNELSPNVSRIFILHSSTSFAQRVLSVAPRVLNEERQFAWIVTGNAYTRNEQILRSFPLGTKAFLMNQDLHVEELLRDTLDFVLAAFQENPDLLKTKSVWLQRGCWNMNGVPPSPFHNDMYTALRKTVVHGLTGELRFDEDGYMNISTFRVRNLVFDGRENVWQDVGCVQGREVRPFGIIWPGDAKSLKSPTEGRKRYRVVTNPVQPFVMTEAPHPDYGECLTDTPCLNLTSKVKSQEEVLEAIDAYESGMDNRSSLYRIQCCRGLTIDLLNKLASDLDFEFTLYIVQDETYGQKKNGTWSGMMKDLIDHTAHFAVAAFSITRVRQKAIDFTDPYFFSGFSVLYSDRTRETSMLAFLEPFDIIVWFAIIISANFTAVAMALFEWNSPFGLNPWGRKRKHNYSLASGLTMVFSVLFGHTVKTKSPKAWPSKVMQNFWAFAAIFIIASYTANLAAFIAGKHAGINYYDIKDNRLLSTRIGSLQGSAVDEFLKRLQSKLVDVSSKYPVRKTDVGIDQVIKGTLDAYLGDYPILDYARAHLAPSCELKLIHKIFGDDQYGLGLPKNSPLKSALSKKIQEYHQTGYVDDLKDVHFADAHCFKKRISEEDSQLEVGHHAGLFVMLCVGFGVGLLTLILEYFIFVWLVPYIRQTASNSIWRSVHLMFFSQRLHRIITSHELVSPHESAREMMGIMRSRDFTRLFMKSTIRKNRLADMAKTKRLNRNFYDIVQKAKWLQEMQASGLMDDDCTMETPNIIEIPLRDLGAIVDLEQSRHQSNGAEGSEATNVTDAEAGGGADAGGGGVGGGGGGGARRKATNCSDNEDDEDDEEEEEEEDKSDQCLLGQASKGQGAGKRACSHSDLLTKLRQMDSSSASSGDSPRHHRSSSADAAASTPLLPLPPPPPPPRLPHSSSSTSSSSGSSTCRGARASKPRTGQGAGGGGGGGGGGGFFPPHHLHHHPTSSSSSSPPPQPLPPPNYASTQSSPPMFYSPSRVRFSDSLPNGSLVLARSGSARTRNRQSDLDYDRVASDNLANDRLESGGSGGGGGGSGGLGGGGAGWSRGSRGSLHRPFFDERRNPSGVFRSGSGSRGAGSEPRDNNIVRSAQLHKTRSYQDHLCCLPDPSLQGPLCLENMSKEELLYLWKTSELDLSKKLDEALKEKARLEKKLALLQNQSPV